EIEAKGRVREARSRRGDERVVLKDRESRGDGRKPLIQCEFVTFVMANSSEVTGQLPGRDRGAFVRETRDVALHGRIEVELAALVELRDRIRSQGFGDTADPKLRPRRGASLGFQIGIPKRLRPHQPAVHSHGDREPGNVGGQFFARDRMGTRARRRPLLRDFGKCCRLGYAGCLKEEKDDGHAFTPVEVQVRYSRMNEKAEQLRTLHVSGPMLVLPNAWDAGSARIFVEAGFPALATTSAGIAFSLGYRDGERIIRGEMLAAVSRITRRIQAPITADMEAGYGQAPDAVAETVRRVIDAGAVGMNLEDRMEEKHLI